MACGRLLKYSPEAKLSDGVLQQLTGHEKRTTADRHVLRDAPMHRHTARAQRVQIAPYASIVATTLVAIHTEDVASHGRIPSRLQALEQARPANGVGTTFLCHTSKHVNAAAPRTERTLASAEDQVFR